MATDYAWLGVEPADDGMGYDIWSVMDLDWTAETPPVALDDDGHVIPDIQGFVEAAHGPNGWPVVNFVGKFRSIMLLMASYHNDPKLADLTVEQLEGHDA